MLQNRQLAAILFTDIVGSTAMMQKDEQAAVSLSKRYVAVLKQFVSSHGGEILNDYGDGSLCTFSSATEALRCAIEMQQQFQMEPKVPLRIGLHVGEIFFEDGKVFGDSINVASRVQSLGIANSILFSSEINSKIKNQQEFKCVSIGKFHFKNIEEPMEIFALSNKGLVVPKKEELTGKLKEIEKRSFRKKLIIAMIAVILLVVSFLIYKNFSTTESVSATEKSIAVLPFENAGVSDSEIYLSDGISQDIINNLSKLSSLQKVIAWYSVKSFKKTTKSVKQIGDELGVKVILTGTFQRHADKIQVTAELIDVSTNKILWGNSYDYALEDVLSIQSEVAQNIAAALKTKLTPEEKREISKHYTDNVEAYKFYRRGRYFLDARTVEGFDSAELNYKKAIKLDPDYALAYSGLADLYIYNPRGLTQREAIPIASDYANKALLLDSTLGEALTTLGFIQSTFDYDWAKSKVTLEKAIAYNPNYPDAHKFYGNLLQYTGESVEQGINEIKKGLALDPLSVNLNYVLGRNYYLAKKYDSAYGQLKKTLVIGPNFNLAKGNLAYTLLAKKNYSEAFEVIKQIDRTGTSKTNYYQGATLSYAYAVSGDKARARAELEKTITEFPDQTPYHLAGIYVLLNDYDEAFSNLEKAYEMRDLFMYLLKVDPTFDSIRNEPRFIALMKKMHLE